MEVTTKEVIKVMIDGGERLCDWATEQWVSGKYDGNDLSLADMRKENLLRWTEIRRQIRVLGKRLEELYD